MATTAKLVVVCPPWVEYSFVGACPCVTGKNLTYQVWVSPTARRVDAATLSQTGKSGTLVQTLRLVNGTKMSFKPVPFLKGDQVTLTFSVLGKSYRLDQMTTNS